MLLIRDHLADWETGLLAEHEQMRNSVGECSLTSILAELICNGFETENAT